MGITYPKSDFFRTTPEAAGIETRAVQAALHGILSQGADLHNMLILRDGALVFEYYAAGYGPHVPHQLYSASKTFTSMAVGAAVDRGLLSLDDSAAGFFPEAKTSGLQKAITVRNLLTMSSGHEADPFDSVMLEGDDPRWAKIYLETPVKYVPGTRFQYETGATYLLGAILTRITGKPVLELEKEWFLNDIGVTTADMMLSPEDCSTAGTNMEMSPVDMARFGLLLLGGGKWEDRQLLPEWYVKEASRRQIHSVTPGNHEYKIEARQGYGFQTWRCSYNAWRADGMCGQLILVCPDQNMVITANCAMDNARANLLVDSVRENLLPGVHNGPLPQNAAAAAALAAYVASVTSPKKPEGAVIPVGTWKFDPAANPLGLSSLSLNDTHVTLKARGFGGRFPWKWNGIAFCGHCIFTVGGWKCVPLGASMTWRDGMAFLHIHAFTEGHTEDLGLCVKDGTLTLAGDSSMTGKFTAVSL